MKKKYVFPIIAVMLCSVLLGAQSVYGQDIYYDNISGEWYGDDYHGGNWTYGTAWTLTGTRGYSRYNTGTRHMSYVTIGNITASSNWVAAGVATDANRVSNYGAVANRCGISNDY